MMLEILRTKWDLQSLFQVILVLTVFSLTGTTVVVLRPVLFAWLGLGADTAMWIKVLVYLAFIFPAYQLLLLGYGFMLGQFAFFWQKERQMWQRVEKASQLILRKFIDLLILSKWRPTAQVILDKRGRTSLKGPKTKNYKS